MIPSRKDTRALAERVGQARELVRQARELLAGDFELINDETRKSLPRPPTDFPDAAHESMRATPEFPFLVDLTKFSAEAVSEDLANAALLAPLAEELTELTRQINDSRLVWLAEAYTPVLKLYGLAQRLESDHPGLRRVVEPLARIFARQGRKKES